MIKEIRPLYTDAIYQEALKRFGIAADKVTDLGGFESYVYAYTRADKEYILKVAHTLHRTGDYLLGELEFVNHLVAGGVNTARAIPSLEGRLVEEIPAQAGSFWAYSFEKVPGKAVKKEEIGPEMIYELGKLTAKMHRLTQSFTPSKPIYKRSDWFADRIYDLAAFFPKEESLFLEKSLTLLERIKGQVKEIGNYGLIHGDLHYGNFFWDEQTVYPFDFDDCEYNFFVNDIAVTLYYSLNASAPDKRWEFSDMFLTNYLKGYETAFRLSKEQLALIPDFMRIRHLVMYTIRYDMFESDQIPPDHQKKMDEIKALLMRDGDVRDPL